MKRRLPFGVLRAGKFRRLFYAVILLVVLFTGLNLRKQWQISKLNPLWRTTFAVNFDPITIVSINPSSAVIIDLITIPRDTLVSVPYGYGQYRLEAIPRLGELEKNPVLFEQTLTDMLAVPVQFILDVPLTAASDGNIINGTKKLFHPLRFLFGSAPFNLVDRVKLIQNIWFVSDKQIKLRDIAKNQDIFPNLTLADGSNNREFKEDKFDTIGKEIFIDPQIQNQHVSIVIFNATQVPKVAAKLGRFVTFVGGDVLRIDNTEKKVANCEIHTTSLYQDSRIVDYLHTFFDCVVVVVPEVSGAHVQLYVGETFAARWKRDD